MKIKTVYFTSYQPVPGFRSQEQYMSSSASLRIELGQFGVTATGTVKAYFYPWPAIHNFEIEVEGATNVADISEARKGKQREVSP